MPKDNTPESKLIDEAKKRFQLCEEAEKDFRDLALDDLKFRAGDQWPEDMKLRRKAARKPCLTINVLPARERQILNENRQNKPAIQVNPVDDDGDPDTAEVIQGIVRHIEYDSDADTAYDTALAFAVRTGGPGWIRIIPEYADVDSFEQVLKIKRVVNPFQVYCDPSAQEADYSDAEYIFYFETLTKDEFKELYPDSELVSLDDWKTVGDKDPNWLSDNGVRVCEYLYRERKQDTIHEVQNAAGEKRSLKKSQLPEKLPRGVKILRSRTTETNNVKWCKFTANEVLEQTDWPGKWLGFVPILGDELYVDGKKVLEGMVRHAKDPMRMNNVMSSEITAQIGLSTKAPWIVASGQTENHPEWDNANTEYYSKLTYDVVNGAPEPKQNVAEPPIQAIAEARALFIDDTKAVTGIYDAQLGAKSNEQSGTAIGQRKVQGELSNFHFADNLARGLKFLGRQIIDLIPKIYNKPAVMRIIGEDGKQELVKVNQKFMDGKGENAVEKIYDLTVGKYDVTVSSGPSYQTKRQEAVATMLQIRQANPHMPPIYDDILFQNMDFPGHEAMAERAKKALPPQLVNDDPGDPEAKLQQTQAQLQQLSAQHQQLTQALNQATEVIKTKQIENQGKMEIVREQERTKILIAEISTKAQESQVRLKMEQEQWLELHGSAHDLGMQKDQQAADAQQAQQAHQQALEQGAQSADNQSAQSAQDAAQQGDLQQQSADNQPSE